MNQIENLALLKSFKHSSLLDVKSHIKKGADIHFGNELILKELCKSNNVKKLKFILTIAWFSDYYFMKAIKISLDYKCDKNVRYLSNRFDICKSYLEDYYNKQS